MIKMAVAAAAALKTSGKQNKTWKNNKNVIPAGVTIFGCSNRSTNKIFLKILKKENKNSWN